MSTLYASTSQHQVRAIIINYCTSELTLQALKSLSEQVELIEVLDNSEDDDQWKELNRLAKEKLTTKQLEKTKFIRAPHNLGFGAGVNFVIARSNARLPYTLLFNSDAIAEPNLVSLLLADSCKQQVFGAAGFDVNFGHGKRYYNSFLGINTRSKFPASFPFLSGACLLINSKLLSEEQFDSRYFMYGEDVDLSWRLLQRGVPLLQSRGRYTHVGSASAGRNSRFYESHILRSHILLCNRIFPDSRTLCIICQILKLFTYGTRALFHALFRRNMTMAKVFIGQLRHVRNWTRHPN